MNIPVDMGHNCGMENIAIFILVGKKIRAAVASRITSAGVAIVPSEHGPLEFSEWFPSREAAEAAVRGKSKGITK